MFLEFRDPTKTVISKLIGHCTLHKILMNRRISYCFSIKWFNYNNHWLEKSSLKKSILGLVVYKNQARPTKAIFWTQTFLFIYLFIYFSYYGYIVNKDSNPLLRGHVKNKGITVSNRTLLQTRWGLDFQWNLIFFKSYNSSSEIGVLTWSHFNYQSKSSVIKGLLIGTS